MFDWPKLVAVSPYDGVIQWRFITLKIMRIRKKTNQLKQVAQNGALEKRSQTTKEW